MPSYVLNHRGGNRLHFPHFSTDQPLQQARRHARYLSDHLKQKLGLTVPVTAVVALPGWFVERASVSDVWVINPKRGNVLKSQLNKPLIRDNHLIRIANHLESVARSVKPASKKMDPDAVDNYDFWMNPRHIDPKID